MAEVQQKIPKDLKRWLKDNGHFTEFIRLVKICGYDISDLSSIYFDKNCEPTYGIMRWFNEPIERRAVQIGKNGNMINYGDFLNKLVLNWK